MRHMSGPAKPKRLRFPKDEARHAWLPLLLDAYQIIDRGVQEGVRREASKGRRLACTKGCAACCRSHLTIPVYPLELIGIYWYATEQITAALREPLKRQLRAYRPGMPCPFLIDDACAIHPMRPAACRQFNVFDRVCSEGEDAYYTRRGDVLTPLQRFMNAAFDRMLPFYGVEDAGQRRKLIRDDRVHTLAKVLQELDWSKLANRMEAHDCGGTNHPGTML